MEELLRALKSLGKVYNGVAANNSVIQSSLSKKALIMLAESVAKSLNIGQEQGHALFSLNHAAFKSMAVNNTKLSAYDDIFEAEIEQLLVTMA